MQKTILVTGGNGLVGSNFIQKYSDSYLFEGLDISNPKNPVDITNQEQVFKAIEHSTAQYIVHFAAYTDVTGAFNQTGDKSGSAYQVNVVGTQNIVAACKNFNKHLIHISTAYVFDGEKEGLYTEADPMNPIEWYGQTKAEAETAVCSSDIAWTVLRIDQPFRSDTQVRPDVVRRIAEGITSGKLYPQFTNHYFGPTFIDDFSRVLDFVIRTKTVGLFNASSGEKWNDYDFAQQVNQTLSLGGTVTAGDLAAYLKTVSRPYQKNTAMDVSKLKSVLDFELLSIQDALKTVVL